MSTRAVILVTDLAGKTTQYYHHHDGYPEYMGVTLDSFCKKTSNLVNFLKRKKDFELEANGTVHIDTSYYWYVKVTEKGFHISYTYQEFDLDYDNARRMLNRKSGDEIYSQI